MATTKTNKPAAAKAKTTKKPAATKAAPKKPAAAKAKTTKKPAATKAKAPKKVTTAREVQAPSKVRKPVADHTAQKTVSSRNRVTTAVKKTTVLGIEVPTLDLRKLDLPSADELRTEVAERLEHAQDAVVGAPERVQEFAGDLHELYMDRFSDAIDKVRELVNR